MSSLVCGRFGRVASFRRSFFGVGAGIFGGFL